MSRPVDIARVVGALPPSPRAWSTADEDALRRHYRAQGPEWCAAHLHRSARAVVCRARRLGLGVPTWSAEELQRLRLVWGELGEGGLCAKFPGRTYAAIVAQARRLDLPPPCQGRVSLRVAAVRAGLEVRQLRIALAEAGVEVSRRVRLGYRKARAKGRYRQGLVDLDAALDAVRAWLGRRAALLSRAEAAAHVGVPWWIVVAALRRLATLRTVPGLPPASGRLWAVRAADVEVAIAQHRDPSRCWLVPWRCTGSVCARGTARGAP